MQVIDDPDQVLDAVLAFYEDREEAVEQPAENKTACSICKRRRSYWNATSAKLRSLRLCSFDRPFSRSSSIAFMPICKC